ncbi:translocation/assembly module TamB domain-containing protein [Acuticoccus kandeliae]|uniref:translocation/assembly module TamB domain-containing protein n=1 Tax=Acuticoccus kandeliae TaxID=2073160 RepID=UPI000D3E5727|nr:translocation/assembly module TamB domain-containing protein [Acuticoccus kandeliae]
MKKLLLLLMVLCVTSAGFALAQDDERSRFVRFVERQISTPDRQITLGRIEGALSSNVRIASISIADRDGTWLTINDVHLVWSRLALLRGRLSIDSLEAASIVITRPPLPNENDQPLEEGAEFAVPELPVSVIIDKLAVPQVQIAEGIIGPAATLGVDGSIRLASGDLEAKLEIERKDRAGTFSIDTSFSNSSRQLAIDVTVAEPADGVIANALNIDGRPPITFEIKGDGPLSDFLANIRLDADGSTLLSGTTTISQVAGGLRFLADIEGNLTPLVADLYDPLVEGGTRLKIDLTRRDSGEIEVSEGNFVSGVASLNIKAALAADGVPTRLAIDGDLKRGDGEPIILPGGGGDATVRAATIDVSLGQSTGGAFSANIVLDELDTPLLSAPTARIEATGTATNLSDPAARTVVFDVTGGADQLTSDDGGLADAIGAKLSLSVSGRWQSGAPVTIAVAEISSDNLNAHFDGSIGSGLDGNYRLEAANLAAFSGLANRDLGGSINLGARGTIGFNGLVDLVIDATTENLEAGIAAVDGLLQGTTTLSGRAATLETGAAFDTFRIANEQLTVTVDGTVSEAEANLQAAVSLRDLAAVSEKAGGPIEARLTVSGQAATPTVSARITSPSLRLDRQSLDALDVAFDGTFDRNSAIPLDLDGTLTVEGTYANEPLNLSTRLDTGDGLRALRGLVIEIAGATAEGSLSLLDSGLVSGDLVLDVPNLSRLAPLALTEAEGSLSATLQLSVTDERQAVDIDAEARQIEVAGISLGFADIDLAIDDALGIPALDGTASLRTLKVAGFDVRTADVTARRDGETTHISTNADLGSGSLSATGTLARAEDGFVAGLDTFLLSREGLAARLVAPTSVSVAGNTVRIDDTELSIGDGRVTIAGTLGDTLDLRARIAQLPLSIANLVRADLGVAGTVSGDVTLSGTRAEPVAAATVSATGVTANMLRERGIDPLTLNAEGRYADGTATIARFETRIGSGEIVASGTVGEALNLTVNVTTLPLALANAFVPDLAIAGTVSGRANVTGSLDDPAADFQVNVANATAAPLRSAGINPVSATLAGHYEDEEASLGTAEVRIAGGTITASGTVGKRLDVTARVTNLPLAIANGFQRDLGASGTVSGEVKARGPVTSPQITFQVNSPSLTAAPLRNAGLPPASINASGSYDRGTVTLSDAVVRIGGGEARAQGTIGRRLDIKVNLANLPVALANGMQPELGLSGTLSGQAQATGSVDNPRATFSLGVDNFSAAALDQANIGSLAIRATGSFANNRVQIASATAQGAGLSVNASGVVPLSGGGLDVRVTASAPLSLAQRFVAERGATISGDVNADVRVTGSIAAPAFSGSVRGSGINFRDPDTNLVLSNGSLAANLTRDRVVIERLSANLGDGTVSVSGSIGLGAGFPADLTVTARNARYADGQLFVVLLDGDLKVTGPLTADPLISGRIDVERAEITVPERLNGSSTLINVNHYDPSRAVLETLRRAKAGPYAGVEEEGRQATGIRLDITISAPRRLFVRGRGIDAEFGGNLRVTGPSDNISPVGRFELIRGRINILSQRIVFTEGAVTLLGDLDPTISLVAETSRGQVTVRVVVSGQASAPDVRFESVPDLPQDEVLAQLLFGRSIGDLSAFQLAQLAAAVAELAGGGGGPNILEQVRVFSGLDNLEIVQTEDGGTSAQAGRYIADNVYVGVRAGDRSSGITLNLDVTRNLTLRGEAMTDETSLGIYFEREY